MSYEPWSTCCGPVGAVTITDSSNNIYTYSSGSSTPCTNNNSPYFFATGLDAIGGHAVSPFTPFQPPTPVNIIIEVLKSRYPMMISAAIDYNPQDSSWRARVNVPDGFWVTSVGGIWGAGFQEEFVSRPRRDCHEDPLDEIFESRQV